MQSRTDGQALSAADLCLVDRQMTHPLWAAVPHGWRWKWLDRDARAAQVEFDARANARRYDGIAADPAAFDDVALDAIGHYLLPGRVLDVGAGTGTYTAHLPGTRFANEPVDAAWAVLCASVPGVQRVGGDAYGLDAPSESFHIVTAFHTLHHLADRPRAFAEWARVLKPGGRLLVVEPRHSWRRAARVAYNWWTEYRHTDDPWRGATHDFCTRGELRGLSADAGLMVRACPRLRTRVVLAADKVAW